MADDSSCTRDVVNKWTTRLKSKKQEIGRMKWFYANLMYRIQIKIVITIRFKNTKAFYKRAMAHLPINYDDC